MEPWAIEEIWLRPLATLIACAALPFVSARVARTILHGRSGERDAAVLASAACSALAFAMGATALGPALVERRGGWVSVAFGVACALLAAGAGVLATRRARREARAALEREPERAAGRSRGERIAGPAVGAVLAAMLAAGAAAAWTLTRIEPSELLEASDGAARWRLRVDPWDPIAMLAAGWVVRARSEERALAWAREAEHAGAPAAGVLELEAEVYAARGECERARATFDRALAVRAEEAFRDPLAAPLELGGYHLPPALVARCGGQ